MRGISIVFVSATFAVTAQQPAQFDPKLNVAAQAAAARGAKPVTGAPYSAVAVRETVQTMADGNRIVNHSEQKIARDGQGRERMESTPSLRVLGEHVAVSSVQITDPVAGARYMLDPKALTARKMAGAVGLGPSQTEMLAVERERAAAAAFQSGSNTSSAKEQLAPQVIEGVYAEGTRTTTTIPAGQIGNERDIAVVDEVWYSPDLHMDVMTRHSDPRSGETTYRVTQINRMEPDAALFQVPAGYTVMDPPKRIELTLTDRDGNPIPSPVVTFEPGR
jgi:hypothetical protein